VDGIEPRVFRGERGGNTRRRRSWVMASRHNYVWRGKSFFFFIGKRNGFIFFRGKIIIIINNNKRKRYLQLNNIYFLSIQ
jgi:hypothetical protein